MSMDPHTHHVTESELAAAIAAAIAEAIELGKKDARAGIVDRAIDDMPEGLEIAFDQYSEALGAELVVMGLES